MIPSLRSLSRPQLAAFLLALVGAPSSAFADDGGSAVAEARRRASSSPDAPSVVVGEASPAAILTNVEAQPIAPGMTLTTFDRLDARGWIRGQLLSVELEEGVLEADAIFAGAISTAAPLTGTATAAGAVAAVNGDFFDISDTGAALGAVVQSGEMVKGPIAGWNLAFGVGTDGLARLATVMLEGTVELPGGSFSLAGLNQHRIPTDGIGLFTPLWGTDTRARSVGASATEVLVQDGRVVSVGTTPGGGPIPENGYVLLGREAGAAQLAGLQVGDPVQVRYAPRVGEGGELHMAIGGNLVLMRDGEIVPGTDDRTSEPRTAVGVSEDGKRIWLLTVDGRQSHSRGMTYFELATLLRDQGAYAALNLDGGGSSTMVARLAGDAGLTVQNSPSDGGERSVPNGIGLFAAEGSGQLAGFRVVPALDDAEATRIFPGLTRTFRGLGHDETWAPVEASPTWRALPADVGQFELGGVLRARKSGKAIAEAKVGGARGSTEIVVLGPLAQVAVAPERIGMEPDATATFAVRGMDAEGFDAPIEPRDVELDYDESLVSIAATEAGRFRVTPLVESGSVLVTVRVQGKEVHLPITIGLRTIEVSDFENLGSWYATAARATASLRQVAGFDGNAVQIDYLFNQSTGTRAAYLRPRSTLTLPGEPQRIGIQVKGDGRGAWLRGVFTDAGNTNYTLNFASNVTWTGWRYVEAVVPAGVRFPLRLSYIYPVETVPAKQYTGGIAFDDLVVKVAQELDIPEPPAVADPLVVQQGTIDPAHWRFAVIADSQFVAASPNSAQVDAARRGLREIVAANPEFVIIAGDLVDTAWPEDFDLADRVLAEEVGDRFPVFYAPGNHEIMGPGNLQNFLARYGTNRGTFDHKGTRFILLDSSTGSFRTADFPQLLDLERLLAEAADDASVKNVLVFAHHPTHDPLPTKNSQLADRGEAALLERWFADFRARSGGKGIAYVAGHAHTADVRRVDGVPYVVMPPNGKAPYGPADKGGIHGWALFGVDPNPTPATARGTGPDWLQMEVRAQLESATIDAPATMAAGGTAQVSATGRQYPSRSVPLRYPASVTWTGSSNVFVGSGAAATRAASNPGVIAIFDPSTGALSALRPGSIQLRIEANGTAAETTVTITP